MKKIKIITSLLLGLFFVFTCACTEDPLKKGKTEVIFWGYADQDEAVTVNEIVEWYNKNNTDGIYIDYKPQPGGTYVDLIDGALVGSKGPDVFYVGDRYLKRWTKFGYLENLQAYADEAEVDFSNVWDSAVWRYRYDPVKNTNNPDDPLYALPKDISPTALYYNASVMERQGIKIISVDTEDLDAFNAGGADRLGNTKTSLNIDAGFEIPAKGFYRDQNYKNGMFKAPAYNDGKVVETMIFNNRIAMSWDEIEDLAMILTKAHNPSLKAEDTNWGYYTEWWFNYGWGVGGDCAVDTTGNGDWEFTLGDKTKKKLLYNSDGTHVTDTFGKAVFVPENQWTTYALASGQYLGGTLPTQYEAFERFIKLGKLKADGGLQIAPRQTSDIGLQSSSSFFSTGKVAMLVQSNYNINSFRKAIKNFEWDVAPLPVYKEYENDNVTVKNRGIEVGHSGSTGLAVWTKSKKKDAAFKVAEYLSMGHAQVIQAQNGFLMPNDKTLATTDYVSHNLAKALPPQNIEMFTSQALAQRPGDWWYMPDNAWIDVWATPLNTQYRENSASLDAFFNAFTESTNEILRNYKQS